MSTVEHSLHSRVEHAISKSPYITQRGLRIEENEGCVTLLGVVNSYYQKQMAQESLRTLDGISQINNELEVAPCSRQYRDAKKLGGPEGHHLPK